MRAPRLRRAFAAAAAVAALLLPGPTHAQELPALYDPQTGAHLRDLVAGTDPSDPAWSPDGAQIALDKGGVIHLIARDGEPGSEVPLTAGVQPIWGGPAG